MISDEHGGQPRYCSPYHGGWDIARIALNLPESYIMFVCPASCARIIGLNAVQNQIKDRISVLGITEDQIVTGEYDEKTIRAASSLIPGLLHRPRVFILFMSCIDSLLGTDHSHQIDELSTRFPDIRFMLMRMSPICRDSGELPLVQLQTDLFSLLKEKKDAVPGVGIIGPNLMLADDNELVQAIRKGGYVIRHLHEMKSYEEFLDMSANIMNLPNVPFGMKAAALLKNRFGAETEPLVQNYDFGTYCETTHKICSYLHIQEPNYEEEQKLTEALLQETVTILAGMPILLDSSATLMPLTLARFLIEYGFHIDSVYVDSTKPPEVKSLEWIKKNAPDVKIIDSGSYKVPGQRIYETTDCLAIGMEAACYGRSAYTLNLFYENTMWGFAGIRQLCHLIQKAVIRKGTVEDIYRQERMDGSLLTSFENCPPQKMETYDNAEQQSRHTEPGMSVSLPPFAPDYGGVCEVFYELGGLTFIHDAAGCTINYTTYDEPRWLTRSSAVYCSGLREIEAVLGDDSVLMDKAERTAANLHPSFIAVVGSSVPMLIGTDFAGIATELRARTGLPCFGIPSTGIHLYDRGASMALFQLVKEFVGEKKVVIPRSVNLCGVIPMDYGSGENVREIRGRFEQAGYCVLTCMTMGCTLSELEEAANAAVNVVMSASGLKTAVYMQQKFDIPYVFGTPIGEKASKQFFHHLDMATGHRSDVVYIKKLVWECITEEICFSSESSCRKKNLLRILLIGEPVISLSMAEELSLKLDCEITVLNPFTSIQELVPTGQLHEPVTCGQVDITSHNANIISSKVDIASGNSYTFDTMAHSNDAIQYLEMKEETAIGREINGGSYQVLVADPVFRLLLKRENEKNVSVFDLPSVSASGGIFY